MNYKEAYEKEHERCEDLTDRVVLLESEIEDLKFKLDRIKNNKFWKLSKPARSAMHFALRQKERLANCGGPKDIARKLANKKDRKSKMRSYGTDSFPTPERAAEERETKFERMVKISIFASARRNLHMHKCLLPLWKRQYPLPTAGQ